MPFNNSEYIERLKRELEEITAERDYLLAENRRLTQTARGTTASDRITDFKSVADFIPSKNTIKKPGSMPLLNSDFALTEKTQRFRSLFHGREDVYPIMWQNKTTLKSRIYPCL
jgi:hypothetical protein